MPGLIIAGKEEQVPGLTIVNYNDDRRLKLKPGEDMRARRTGWIRMVTLHNTKNRETIVIPGIGKTTDLDHRIARLWSGDGRNAGAHLSADWDGAIGCHADLLHDATYHAGQINEVSIGIEIYEDMPGHVYQIQLMNVRILVEYLCYRFGIQRQIPHADFDGTIKRMIHGAGRDCVGVFGHCHAHAGKRQDPGRSIFLSLKEAGFTEFDFNKDEDKAWWMDKQNELGLDPDGVAGPATCDALHGAGYVGGVYYHK